MGVKRLFERGVQLAPDRICVDDGSTRLTYRELRARSRAIAGALQAEGLGPDVHCAYLSRNCTEGMAAIIGIYQADNIFVPLNISFPAADNARPINDCEVSVLFYHSALIDDVREIVDTCPGLKLCICVDSSTDIGVGLDELVARHPGAEPLPHEDRLEDITAIYPTGGSTGRPKRVLHNRRIWNTMAASFLTALPVKTPPVYLAVPPLTHASGTFVEMLMAEGGTAILHDGFDAPAVLEAIERYRITHLFLPPTAIYRLLETPGLRDHDYSSLEAFIYTAAPMSVDKLATCIEVFGPVMVQFWGQTEAPSFCTALTAAEHVLTGDARVRLGSCGRPTLLTEVAIMAEDGTLLGPHERGELVVRGDIVMIGYYNNPEATAEASKYGWHHTGDVGYRDENGYFYIAGRLSDMIITGGYNVYPSDIEQVLWSHPSVGECAVVGVPDEKWGEAVTAVVELKPGGAADAAELIAFCRERLGAVKTPKAVHFISDMPRNAIGKVDKLIVRQLLRDAPATSDQ